MDSDTREQAQVVLARIRAGFEANDLRFCVACFEEFEEKQACRTDSDGDFVHFDIVTCLRNISFHIADIDERLTELGAPAKVGE